MKKYDNYVSNLRVLSTAGKENLRNEFIISGIIDKFSLQFELGWKMLKEFLRYEGITAAQTGSPREIIKAAYSVYDFMNEEIWIEMLRDRNDMTHIYDGTAATQLVQKILNRYIPEFLSLQEHIEKNYQEILTIQ